MHTSFLRLLDPNKLLGLLVGENGEKVELLIVEATVANKTRRTDQIYFDF